MERRRDSAAGRHGGRSDRHRKSSSSSSPDPHHHYNSSKYNNFRRAELPPHSISDELNHHRRREDEFNDRRREDEFNDRRHRRRNSPPPPAYRRSPGRRGSPLPAYNNSIDGYRERERSRDRDRDRERDTREYRRATTFDIPAGLPLPPPPPPLRRYSPLHNRGGDDGAGFHAMSPLPGQKRDFSSFSEDMRGPFLPILPPPHPPPVAVSGNDGGSYTKLFIGSVPCTVTEEDVRPVFEKHGHVIEVALIRDKKTGQQQGCCFVKYGTSQEADIAIKMLHNQHTLPGGSGPIQVRYADGERERLGTVEFKLFVGSLNKLATEKDIEPIFAPYGQVEDIYLMRDEMRLSRGCGFVKYKYREMALAAINALNGKYTMPGCDTPMTVRFADSKKPRLGESKGGTPALGGPGFGPLLPGPGPQLPSPVIRPPLMQGEPMHGHFPANAWQPMSPQKPGIPNSGFPGFGNHFQPRAADMSGINNGSNGFSTSTSIAGNAVSSTSTTQLNYGQSLLPMPSAGQQISPLHKPLQSPPHLPFSLKLQSPNTPSFAQPPVSHQMIRPVSQSMFPGSVGQTPNQSLPVSARQYPAPHTPAGANQQLLPQQQSFQPPQQSPSHLAQLLAQQRQTLQASFQSSQQAFSQLQQQLQSRQAANQNSMPHQSSVPAKDQSQWSGTGTTPHSVGIASTVQQSGTGNASQTVGIASTDQQSGTGNAPQTVGIASTVQQSGGSAPVNSTTLSTASDVAPIKCNWTEHTSPDGYKYYYNSATGESKWDKPKELEVHEQQQPPKPQVQYPQMQQNPPVQMVPERQSQVQNMQPQPQIRPQLQTQNRPQLQLQNQPQLQFQNQPQIQFQNRPQLQPQNRPQLQQSFPSSKGPGVTGHQNAQELRYKQPPIVAGPKSTNDPAPFQQIQQTAAQDWMWKNNPAGM